MHFINAKALKDEIVKRMEGDVLLRDVEVSMTAQRFSTTERRWHDTQRELVTVCFKSPWGEILSLTATSINKLEYGQDVDGERRWSAGEYTVDVDDWLQQIKRWIQSRI